MNANPLIFTAAEYKIFFLVNGHPYPIFTCTDFSANTKKEDETIYAVGQVEPIGEKTNAESYAGKLSMQAGELQVLLTAEGYTRATQIEGAIIAIAHISSEFARIYKGVNMLTEDVDIKAKDKQTLIPMSWKAVEIS